MKIGKRNFKTKYCNRRTEFDNPVEPNQSMTVQEMFAAYVSGYDLPDKHSNGYDEDITIDEVGYSAEDTMDAVDYLNAVNQRIASANASQKAMEFNQSETVTETTNVSE